MAEINFGLCAGILVRKGNNSGEYIEITMDIPDGMGGTVFPVDISLTKSEARDLAIDMLMLCGCETRQKN